MEIRVDTDGFEGAEIEILQVWWRWFDDDLILIIVLKPIWVFTIAAILGAARGLHVSRGPMFWADRAQSGGRMKCASAHFHVIGLQNHTALLCPIIMEGQD